MCKQMNSMFQRLKSVEAAQVSTQASLQQLQLSQDCMQDLLGKIHDGMRPSSTETMICCCPTCTTAMQVNSASMVHSGDPQDGPHFACHAPMTQAPCSSSAHGPPHSLKPLLLSESLLKRPQQL